MKTEIYEAAENLGLSKKEVDSIMSGSATVKTSNGSVDIYKAGTKYGTVSSADLYKAGTDYGTVSPKDVYKAGTRYGVVSPKDVYKAGTIYGTISIKDF